MKLPALEALLLRLTADLRETGVKFAVVGGLAVGARLGGRFTRDVDVAVSVAAATPEPVFPDELLPTARIPHLIAMKLLSESDQRLQDRIDLQHPIAAPGNATESDLAEVPPLLTPITERGFHRNKDLPATLEGFLGKR